MDNPTPEMDNHMKGSLPGGLTGPFLQEGDGIVEDASLAPEITAAFGFFVTAV